MSDKIVIIGAGIGGLACAMTLAHAGCDVTVVDQHDHVGGKMRVMDSVAGPVDAGPTVLTLRPIFETLFDACGTSLSDHVTLAPLDLLARHHWDDGTSLDLFADAARSEAAIEAFAGPSEAKALAAFHNRAKALFDAFEAPMMQAPSPTLRGMASVVLRHPGLIPALLDGPNLARSLERRFRDPRLRQLFGRYATYVGGAPGAAPALLSLIWHAEARGVWTVDGGMHRLAQAMGQVAEGAGATILLGQAVTQVSPQGPGAHIHLPGKTLRADKVVFNGDPKALFDGLLGDPMRQAVPRNATDPRSLSAYVWSFAAHSTGLAPSHHNVFFAHRVNSEFDDIAQGRLPEDPTLYVCAQDRGAQAPMGSERFEIIINGPPRRGTRPNPEEQATCQEMTFSRLAQMGLTFDQIPGAETLTTPEQFNALFPASDGSLYGRSPHGMMAAFKRPTARTAMPWLYLAGGGAHPGAGIPMAATSGRLAAEAILTDLASTWTSRRMAMPGGISTGSATAAPARSRSSLS